MEVNFYVDEGGLKRYLAKFHLNLQSFVVIRCCFLKIKLWDLIHLPHFTKNATLGMRPQSRVRQPLHGGEHGDHGQGQQSPVYVELIN